MPAPATTDLTGATKTKLTLTGLYNVMQALREGRELTAVERAIHHHGLVGVLKELHDELDAAVLKAYGWSDLAPALRQAQGESELLARLLALNALRATEEASGTVRWLRPEFQSPPKQLPKAEPPTQVQQALGGDFELEVGKLESEPAPLDRGFDPISDVVQPWPTTLPEQVRSVAQVLASAKGALTLTDIEASFKGRGAWKKGLPILLQTLEALGRAQRAELDGETRWRL